MKKMLSLIGILVLGLLVLSGCAQTQQSSNQQSNTVTSVEPTDAEQVKTFVLTGENFKFLMNGQEAPELRVKEGDKVRIEFTSADGFHDWVVDEFNAATERVQTDGSTFVEFIADKKGTFEYYCSVGQHRENGMIGNLIVE